MVAVIACACAAGACWKRVLEKRTIKTAWAKTQDSASTIPLASTSQVVWRHFQVEY